MWWNELLATGCRLFAVEEGAWVQRLGLALTEAERSEAEHRGVVSMLEHQRDTAARRSDTRALARAVWTMALVELHVGNDELAEVHARQGLPLLAGAEEVVVRLATANVLQRMLHRARPGTWTLQREQLIRDAVGVLSTSAPSWSSSLALGLAEMLLEVGRHEDCLAVCEAAFASRSHYAGNPYRSGVGEDVTPPHDHGDQRALLIHLVGVRARAHERLGGYVRALDSVRESVEMLGGVTDAEARTIAWLRGYLAYRDGRYVAAERELDFALGPDVDLLVHHAARDAALDALGWTYLEMGMLSEAAGVAKRMAELNPGDPQPTSLLAKVELERDNVVVAHECAARALATANALDGGLGLGDRNTRYSIATASLVIAEVALRCEDFDRARAHASVALARARSTYPAEDPALLDPLLTMAEAETACQGHGAEALLREAVALRFRADHPKRARALRAYGVFLESVGRVEEARAALVEAMAIARPGSDPE